MRSLLPMAASSVKLTTDSDWANEARTRKSHTGKLLQVGHHLVQHDPLVHAVDAPACKSMLLSHGSQDLRHLETKNLWVQEAVKSKHIKVAKFAGEVNAADSLACLSATNILRDHMRLIGCDLIDNQEHFLSK